MISRLTHLRRQNVCTFASRLHIVQMSGGTNNFSRQEYLPTRAHPRTDRLWAIIAEWSTNVLFLSSGDFAHKSYLPIRDHPSGAMRNSRCHGFSFTTAARCSPLALARLVTRSKIVGRSVHLRCRFAAAVPVVLGCEKTKTQGKGRANTARV